MRLPPRNADEPLIAPNMLKYALSVGLLLILSVFFVYERTMLRSADLMVAQTSAVNAIVFGEMFFLLNARSFRNPLTRIGLFSNKQLLMGLGMMAGLQIVFTHAGFMNRIFGTAPLSAITWLCIIAASLVIFFFVELIKWYDRYRGARPSNS
jgi:Ca2+-transporting ATPase